MKKIIFALTLLLLATSLFSQRQSKYFPFEKIIGVWNSTAKINNTKHSDFHYKDFNIEFINSTSLRFLLPKSNLISHIDYLYEIDSIQGFSIIKYHQEEVSTIYEIILFVMEGDEISLVIVDPKNLSNPLMSLNDENWHYILKKKIGN
jgi:hypothetical protein